MDLMGFNPKCSTKETESENLKHKYDMHHPLKYIFYIMQDFLFGLLQCLGCNFILAGKKWWGCAGRMGGGMAGLLQFSVDAE